MELKIIKLVSGEEIIATISDHTDNTVTVDNPYVFLVGRDPMTGQPGFDFAPLLLSTQDLTNIVLNRDLILCIVENEPADFVRKAYLKQVSKIEIVENASEIIKL